MYQALSLEMRVSKTEMPDALVCLCFSQGVDIRRVNPRTVVSTSRPRRRALRGGGGDGGTCLRARIERGPLRKKVLVDPEG